MLVSIITVRQLSDLIQQKLPQSNYLLLRFEMKVEIIQSNVRHICYVLFAESIVFVTWKIRHNEHGFDISIIENLLIPDSQVGS